MTHQVALNTRPGPQKTAAVHTTYNLGYDMTVPEHDEHGHLPPGEHIATWSEVKERFGGRARRREIVGALEHTLYELKNLGVRDVWLNGSFVTTKIRPSDVDVVYSPPPDVDTSTWGNLANSDPAREHLKAQRRVDLWEYPSPQYVGGTKVTIVGFFCSDKEDRPKGIIRLDLGSLP